MVLFHVEHHTLGDPLPLRKLLEKSGSDAIGQGECALWDLDSILIDDQGPLLDECGDQVAK